MCVPFVHNVNLIQLFSYYCGLFRIDSIICMQVRVKVLMIFVVVVVFYS